MRQWTDCAECGGTGIVMTEDGDPMECYGCHGKKRVLAHVEDTEPLERDLAVAGWETFGDWQHDEWKLRRTR